MLIFSLVKFCMTSFMKLCNKIYFTLYSKIAVVEVKTVEGVLGGRPTQKFNGLLNKDRASPKLSNKDKEKTRKFKGKANKKERVKDKEKEKSVSIFFLPVKYN